MVEQRSIGRRARFGIFAAGIFAWAFALSLTRDVDYAALFGVFPDPWGNLLAAPFRDTAAKFLLALCSGLGMVMLVTDAPRRLKVYGALLAFTAPLYALARLLGNA